MILPEGSFVTQKAGPLPVWAWMGLGLGLALAVASWNKNKADQGKTGVVQQYELPENIDPQFTFVDADTHLTTIENHPPGGGRPPAAPVPPPPPLVINFPQLPKLPVITLPKPPPPPPPGGLWQTVVKYVKNPPRGTPSSLWGMAEKHYGNGTLWPRIWNAPQNAALRARRGAPEKIQPGDKFWIPK